MASDKQTRPVRVRIAPSPTGNCHVGTARNTLYNYLFARQHGGQMILRIDDTDARRSTVESEHGVLAGLRWLGLDWDEGPDVGGPFGPYRQSERMAYYQEAVQQLLDADRAYYCFCTPAELAVEREAAVAAGQPPRYSGKCSTLSRHEAESRVAMGEPYVVRLRIAPGMMAFDDLVRGEITADASLLGDPVIIKADGMPMYSLATVVDEEMMHISHVLRSAEHISNTFLQLQLCEALGYEPPLFAHLALLLNPDRTKISKRDGAVYIGEFQQMGYLREAMINHLALSGWNPGTDKELYTLDELVQAFSIERCSRADAIYDRPKLLWLNGQYIRQLGHDELAELTMPFLQQAGFEVPNIEAPLDYVGNVLALEQERLKTLADAPETTAYFFKEPDAAACVEILTQNRYAKKHTLAELGEVLGQLADTLQALEEWSETTLEQVLEEKLETLGWKRGELYMPVRIAVSGRWATPGVTEMLVVMGKERVVRRLRNVRAATLC